MATVIIQQKKVCDLCGKESDYFINGNGEKLTANMGYIQSQSDRWEKTLSIDIKASIPYHPSDDICIDCLNGALKQILRKIEEK